MKWVLYVLGGLAGLILLIVLIGYMLPKNHKATRQARFRQKPEQVFALISGPPAWRDDIKSAEDLPPANGHRRWKEIDSRGDAIMYEQVEATPPTRLVTRIADETLPYGGTWTHEISSTAEGSVLRITEDGEVRNPLFRFVSKFIMGHTATINKYLQSVGKKFNQEVKIED